MGTLCSRSLRRISEWSLPANAIASHADWISRSSPQVVAYFISTNLTKVYVRKIPFPYCREKPRTSAYQKPNFQSNRKCPNLSRFIFPTSAGSSLLCSTSNLSLLFVQVSKKKKFKGAIPIASRSHSQFQLIIIFGLLLFSCSDVIWLKWLQGLN